MKNQVKFIAFCLVFIVLCSTCIFAKQYVKDGKWVVEKPNTEKQLKGWQPVGDNWNYYQNGQKVCDEVVKSADKFFYLNEEGFVDKTEGKIIRNEDGVTFKITKDGVLEYLGGAKQIK